MTFIQKTNIGLPKKKVIQPQSSLNNFQKFADQKVSISKIANIFLNNFLHNFFIFIISFVTSNGKWDF